MLRVKCSCRGKIKLRAAKDKPFLLDTDRLIMEGLTRDGENLHVKVLGNNKTIIATYGSDTDAS